MENYKLKENEVVLYKGDIKLAKNNEEARLILTNLNLVFVPNSNEGATEVYPVEEIKVYENQPQVKTRGNIVEIYLTSTEKEFSFVHKLDSLKFMNAIKKLLTGKTASQRYADKVKSGLQIVEDALDVGIVKNIGGTIKDIVETGKSVKNGIAGVANIFKRNNKE
ncbi:MAG: hypothetical protein IKT27_05415 [Clostridia bacterium]|nr:hypothetical protein [Clostridia bacterium]